MIVVNGDGCTLMNLGCLVTLAHHPADVYLLVFDNQLYEVTGGQATAGTGHADFAAMARAAGIARVYKFDCAETWKAGAAEGAGRPGTGGDLAQNRRPARSKNPGAARDRWQSKSHGYGRVSGLASSGSPGGIVGRTLACGNPPHVERVAYFQ